MQTYHSNLDLDRVILQKLISIFLTVLFIIDLIADDCNSSLASSVNVFPFSIGNYRLKSFISLLVYDSDSHVYICSSGFQTDVPLDGYSIDVSNEAPIITCPSVASSRVGDSAGILVLKLHCSSVLVAGHG